MGRGKENGCEQVPAELPADVGQARRTASEGEQQEWKKGEDAEGAGVLPGEGLSQLDTGSAAAVVVCPDRKRIDGIADENMSGQRQVNVQRPVPV